MISDTLYLWLPAWIAGILVLITHVPLGQQVLRQGVIFLDLAIAQAAGLGVILAQLLGVNPKGWALQITALSSALLMAVIFQVLEKRKNSHLEAWIGCSFVMISSMGLWILSGNTHASEHLREILMGQILWVTPDHLGLTLIYYLLAASLLWWNKSSFYLIFAICVTAAVQLVGVYLVFASLIMPALATSALKTKRAKLWQGYLLGLVAYTIGIISSCYLDAPASPVIIFFMALGMFSTLAINYFKRTGEVSLER